MYMLLALALLLQDDLRDLGRKAAEEAAAKLQDEVSKLAEKDSRSFNERGVEMVLRGNGLAAKYCFGSALAADAANVSAAANLGFTLLRLGEVDGAEAVLSLAAKRYPDCGEVLNNYAWVLAERGKFADALKLLDACKEIYSAHPQLDYGRAWLLEKLGREAEARDLAAEVVALYPKHEEAKVLLLVIGELADTQELARLGIVRSRRMANAQRRAIERLPLVSRVEALDELLGGFDEFALWI